MRLSEINIEELSPMMRQYVDTKKEYSDCILFYRLGDFYEMFFEDAYTASKELELTLTGKSCGLSERVPMCGVPFHACDSYINRLVKAGYKVAIGEQVEDPKLAKGIVKREVIRVVTPGTNTDMASLEESKHNYILCLSETGGWYGLSFADVTTGDFLSTKTQSKKQVMDEIQKFTPSEVLCKQNLQESFSDLTALKERTSFALFTIDNYYYDISSCVKLLYKHFKITSPVSLGLETDDPCILSAGALLTYLYETQKIPLSNITSMQIYSGGLYMLMDGATRRNLELCETMREKQKRGSLFWVLDKTKTAMGARALRNFIEQPLVDKNEILNRQDVIEEFSAHSVDRDEIREYLNTVYDLERLLTKVIYGSVNPRDMLAFKGSLSTLPYIKNIISECEAPLLKDLYEDLDALQDIAQLIENSIMEEPPISIREGGFIRDGFSDDIDELRKIKTGGKTILASLEEKEREETGIKTLKIKYNKVFGYYMEVTNSFLSMVPAHYIRKQTLTGGERYTTAELKELEDKILNAEDKLNTLEYDAFCELRQTILDNLARVQKTAKVVALIDVFTALSFVAERNHYIRPQFNDNGVIDIKGGRHPVVEKMIPEQQFIENDTFLNNGKNQISIITGPNMAGKSTYMRQVALIVLMAQTGSFIPAESANLSVVDRIFTRVGASDDLASGQSTFMMEMNEVANILCNATKNSLLILDEIGRGTSTYDGLSIAWAVVENIANPKLLGAKTLFATHYHELTELEGKMPCVNNYCIAVKEKGDDIVFLRKIIKGGADRSYGIQVAKLAGIPDMVIDRAKEIAELLSVNDIADKMEELSPVSVSKEKSKPIKKPDEVEAGQLSFIETVSDEEILSEIRALNVPNMTPLDALNTLYRLQNRLNNRM